MKIRTLFFTLSLLILANSSLFAKFVPKEDARKVAHNFFAHNIANKLTNWSLDELNITDVTTRYSGETPMFYVFSNNGHGFIIVSADDALTPVWGFSYEGSFPEQGKVSQLDYILGDYQKDFEYVKSNNLSAVASVSQDWETFHTNSSMAKSITAADTLGPLLTSTWDQDYPYNAYCPKDARGPNGYTYSGCVAAAMSQIMYYYRWPQTGTGQSSYSHPKFGVLSANYGATTYNWDAMRNNITTANGNNSIPAIAELQYQCGVSVKMQYSLEMMGGIIASGAYSEDVPAAIKSHFKYSADATFLRRNATWAMWEGYLIAELNKKQPLYYSGTASGIGGHAWVCDGYTTIGSGKKYFHHNFGWSGWGNGFYIVEAPSAGEYNFRSDHAIVRNFVPDTTYRITCNSRTITPINGSFQSANIPRQKYSPNQKCQYLIAPTDSVKQLIISFPYFDLDNTDTLYVYDGENASAPLLGKFTGSVLPQILNSTSNKAYVVFISDTANEKTGWQVEYTGVLPDFCSGYKVFSTQEGTIDDGSKTAKYNNNTYCRWSIQPSEGRNDIKLTFKSFDLAKNDFVEIRSMSTNQLIAKVSGNQIPGPYVVHPDGFLLIFTTDNYEIANGFEFNYNSFPDAVAKLDEIAEVSISPNPSTGNVTVEFSNIKGKDFSISVKDITGKEVYYEKSKGSIGGVNKPLDLSHLQQGMYILTISTNTSTSNKKIILQ